MDTSTILPIGSLLFSTQNIFLYLKDKDDNTFNVINYLNIDDSIILLQNMNITNFNFSSSVQVLTKYGIGYITLFFDKNFKKGFINIKISD
jgi:hypothetical protein